MGIVEGRAALHQLQEKTRRSVSSAGYVAQTRELYRAARARLVGQFGGICTARIDDRMEKAWERIARASEVEVSLSHGDFQAGNLLMADGDARDRLFIVDWEDVGERAAVYDAMTFNLCTRTARDLRGRVEHFLKDPRRQPFPVEGDPKLALALWFVEDWIWLFGSSSRQGITSMPLGLCRRFENLS